MNPETLANLVRETYQPIQTGGGLDQPPITGKRTLENSPKLFPHLSLEGCKFLEGVANVAICLEEQLSLHLTPNNQNIPYTPLAIKNIVDIAEMLASTPETNSLNPRKNGSQSKYSLSEVFVTKVSVYGEDGNSHQSVEGMEISFSGSGDVEVSIQPTTIRQTFALNGKRRGKFDGVPITEVKEIESFRGRSPEEVSQTAEDHQEIHPALTITSGKAKFMITFRQDAADCELSIQGVNYNYDSQTGDEQQADDDGESVSVASIKEEYVKIVPMVVPLTDFRSSKKLPSQDNVDQWLTRLVSEMAGKVKRY